MKTIVTGMPTVEGNKKVSEYAKTVAKRYAKSIECNKAMFAELKNNLRALATSCPEFANADTHRVRQQAYRLANLRHTFIENNGGDDRFRKKLLDNGFSEEKIEHMTFNLCGESSAN